MENIIDFISQPWHWFPSGLAISTVMLILILLGKHFGISSSYRAACSILGAGKKVDYFNYNWKSHDWLIAFIIGSIIGGFIAFNYLNSGASSAINIKTIMALKELNIEVPQDLGRTHYIPEEIFSFEYLKTVPGVIIMVVGGFLIGFGTRWAGGCTSGHAITGLSNLQLPSLVAVIGFFIGGLLMTHYLLPIILSL
ncbi:MAG: YeeE/YedE thiosulfate transporter family protein [Saprospiraceae bacterium]